VAVQRAFRRQFGRRGPSETSIRRWYGQFRYRGCICHQGKGCAGRPTVTEETVDRGRETFFRSPRKSVRRAIRELKIPETTARKILRKLLQLYPYKLQLIQNAPIIFSHPVFKGCFQHLGGWGACNKTLTASRLAEIQFIYLSNTSRTYA
jgi:predicted transcriptional regulator with HTH domain